MRPTLLIVDDHAGFRASARRLLEAEGFAVAGEVDDASASCSMRCGDWWTANA